MSRIGILARIEAVKLRRSRSLLVTLATFVLINGALVIGSLRVARGPFEFSLPSAWLTILEVSLGLGPLMLGVLVILLLAPEFTWRTARQSVIDGLAKSEFLLGKCLALAAIIPLFFLIPILIGGVGALLGPDASSSPLVRPSDLSYMAAYAMGLLLFASAAMLIAVLVRASGAAIGVLVAYWILESIAVQAIRAIWPRMEGVLRFLPAKNQDDLSAETLHYEAVREEINAGRVEAGQLPLDSPDLWVPLAISTFYIVLFMALSFYRIRTRDL